MSNSLRRTIRLFTGMQFLIGLIFTIPIWIPFYRQYISFSEIALLMSIQTFVNLVMQLPTGAFADIVGRRKSMMIGLVLQSIGALLVIINPGMGTFIVAAIVVGLGVSLVSGADTALVFDSLKEEGMESRFPNIIANSNFFFRIGMMIATFIGGLMYQYSQQLPYIMKAIFIFLSVFTVYFIREPKIDSEKFTTRSFIFKMKSGFIELTKNAEMVKLTVFYVLMGSVSLVIISYFIQPFSYEFNFTESQNGIIFSIVYFLYASVMLVVTRYKKYFTKSKIIIGFPLYLAFFLLTAILIPKEIAPVFILALMFPTGIRLSIFDKFVHDEFNSKNRATAMSSLSMLINIIYMIIVLIGGKIQDANTISGTRVIFFGLGLICILIIIPVSISLRRTLNNVIPAKAGI